MKQDEGMGAHPDRIHDGNIEISDISNMRSAPQPSGFASGGLSVPKASDILAEHLRNQILAGHFSPGTPLPVERELAASSRLSRTVVREALRILEIEGLIEIRPGRAGGSFVCRPGVRAMGRTVDAFVSSRGIPLRSLLQVREAIEPTGAELAALNRSDEDMDRLDLVSARLEAALDEPPKFLAANIEWHETVVRASGNELLFAFIRSMSHVLLRATDIAHFNSDDTRARTARAHRRIIDAIRDQDAASARFAMERHVLAYRLEAERIPNANHLLLDTTHDLEEEDA